jgi:hypothetical protein
MMALAIAFVSTHIDSFRQGLCDTLGTPVSKKFRSRKSVRFIFTHANVKIDRSTSSVGKAWGEWKRLAGSKCLFDNRRASVVAPSRLILEIDKPIV